MWTTHYTVQRRDSAWKMLCAPCPRGGTVLKDSGYSLPHSRGHVCTMQCDFCFRGRTTSDGIFALCPNYGLCLEDVVCFLSKRRHHAWKIQCPPCLHLGIMSAKCQSHLCLSRVTMPRKYSLLVPEEGPG